MYHTIQGKKCLTILCPVISDDLHLIEGHEIMTCVSGILRSIPDTIQAVSSTLFRYDAAVLPGVFRYYTAVLPGDNSDYIYIVKTLTFNLNYEAISNTRTTFCIIFKKFQPRTFKCSSWIENRPSRFPGWEGGERNAPIWAQGSEIPHYVGCLKAPPWLCALQLAMGATSRQKYSEN